MKFSKLSQLFLVSSIGLVVASLLTACQIVTIDYLYVACTGTSSSSDGEIQTFAVDSESGALRNGAAAVTSGGVGPVSMAATSDYDHLYVANQGSKSIVHFAVASNGVLTQKDSVTLSGTPFYLAVNKAGTYLFALTCTNSSTYPTISCSAGTAYLTEYALSSGTIGSATQTVQLQVSGYTGDIVVPTSVTVMPNGNAVYVTAYDQSAYNPSGTTTSDANPGWVFGYTIGSSGTLTAASNSPWEAGVKPTSIVVDPTDLYAYVTDWASNDLIGYSIQSGEVLNYLTTGPYTTGNEPSAVTIDPRAKFIYVSNSSSGTVSAYTYSLSTGAATSVMSSSSGSANSTDTWPVAVVVDPALGRFVYTANNLGNDISGFRLNATAGTLNTTQATPYTFTGGSTYKPTALVCVPHGNHSVQYVTSY
jgi:6-phosphogluconolactonase (cycloisomerase 2 family)